MDTATSNTGGGSAFASDSSTNLATVIKGLKKFDGKDPAEFKTWMKKFCVVLGVTRKDILPLLKKQRKPDPADTAAFDSYTRANEDLYAILFLLVELPAALSIQKHEDDTGISGDGQAAFEELCNNYDRVTDEVIRAKMEELENNPMNPGENPDDYFNQKHLLRTQLDKMGEPISDRRFKDICVQGFSDEYKDVKLMVFRDPTFNVLDMQSTMRNIFLDEQSRKRRKGRIAGRGFAMATTASDIICHGCYEPGHIRRNCPKIKNRAKKKTKPAGATKWCSKHNTTSHSDEECYQQGGKRPGDTKDSSKAFTACSNCTHCSSASNKHDSNNEVAVVDFTRDEDAFDSGFMFATCSRISGRNFAASSTGVGLLVDTGASETMFDNRLIPDGNLHDYTQRNSPKIVDVAGESQLKGTATGILHCTVKDNRGQRLRVRIQGLIVVPHQKQSQTHTANAVCFTLVSADTWHRRLGHLNARSLDILRKDTGTGVDYRDSLSPCGVCQIAKHKQSPHPKQSTRELSRPGQLVVIDNMGPVNPPAKYKGGSFPYACKITDDYTKMKEVYLLRKKSDTTEAVHTYNMCVAAAGGYRIETIRCDKGGENTGSEFRDYCKNSAIKLEYAATNTPQQIGVSERDGQTLAGVTRCLLKDGDFPPSMWGELMLTAAYLLNRSPHSALGGATPYSKLHNKSPDLSGLRVIGARAFVHHERYRKKLDDRAFEGKLCGFGLDSQTYRILNPSNGAVVESRNVTFIESPPRSVPFQYSTEANGYESDVLSFTSLLDSPHSTSDLDFMAQNELLRQEVRKMQQDNLAREEIRLELDGHEDEHGNGQDLGDGDAPSPHLPSTPAGPSSETHASSPSPSSSIPPEPDTSASPGSSGMRRLQVTRASTRGKPTSDDHIDVNLVPANLEVTMNDRGRAHATTGRVEPSGLSFTQLAEIADQAQLPCPGDTEDFAHVAEDPFTVPRAHAYVTTTHEHHGILEETNQAIQNPQHLRRSHELSPARRMERSVQQGNGQSAETQRLQSGAPQQRSQGEKILGTKFVSRKAGRTLQSSPGSRRTSSRARTGLRTQLRASMPYREHSHNVRHWLPQQLAHLPTGRCRCLPERPLRQRCVRQTRPRYIRQELRDGRTHGVQTRTEPLRPIAVACALERHPERIPHGVRMEKDSIRPLRVRVYQRQHHRDSHGLRRRHSHHGRRPAARGPEEEGAHGSIRDDDMGEVKRPIPLVVGLVNREKKKEKKTGSPPPPSCCSFGESKIKITRRIYMPSRYVRRSRSVPRLYEDSYTWVVIPEEYFHELIPPCIRVCVSCTLEAVGETDV